MSDAARPSYVRIPNAHGTLVATDEQPDAELVPSLLAVSDVHGHRLVRRPRRRGEPGSTVVVVGDGAVGLCGVIAAKELGAERIIAMSRHDARQKLAREFGATDIVARARRRRRRPRQGPHRRHRRRLRAGVRRHRTSP